MEDVEKSQAYISKKLTVYFTILLSLVSSLPNARCNGTKIIEDEKLGREIMMGEVTRLLGNEGFEVIPNPTGKPYDLVSEGKKTLTYPDFSVKKLKTGNPYHMLGEFDSPNDEFTSKERRVAEANNLTAGTEAGKFLICDPDTEEGIKEQVRNKLESFGLIYNVHF